MLDPQIIAELQVLFADIPEAIASLETIADCEGDLEDAAMTLAIRAGQQPDINNSEWLDGLAKKCRVAICHSEFPIKALSEALNLTSIIIRTRDWRQSIL
jgi:hypothetical protein